jgi:c-di-GMP-binding flagellar brake protein YcgR
MATGGPTVFNSDKRQASRVPFRRSVKIFTQDTVQGRFTAQNLSLGGMFVEGSANLPVGQVCRIELHEEGQHSSMIYHVCGKIAHRDKNGMGIQFLDMEDYSFNYLQTMVLYASDDPIETAEHFMEGFTTSTC